MKSRFHSLTSRKLGLFHQYKDLKKQLEENLNEKGLEKIFLSIFVQIFTRVTFVTSSSTAGQIQGETLEKSNLNLNATQGVNSSISFGVF